MTLLLALVMVGKAQSLLLDENFDSGIPTTWTLIDADGDGVNWVASTSLIGEGGGHNGSAGAATSQSYDNTDGPLNPDNWLITPRLNISAAALLTFWVAAQDASYPEEHYGVYVSTSADPQDIASYTLLFEETLDANGGTREQGAWKQKSALLTQYVGQQVYIAFRHFNVTDMFYIHVDDVQVLPIADPLIVCGSTSLTFPTKQLGTTFANKTFSCIAAALDEDLVVSLPEGTPFSISTDSIEGFGNSLTFTPDNNGIVTSLIYVKFAPTVVGYYETTVSLTSTGAEAKTLPLTAIAVDCSQHQTLSWYETFSDDEFPGNCWSQSITDTNQYSHWYLYGGGETLVRGDDDNDQDEKLFTPTFDLTNANAADFSFDFTTNLQRDEILSGDAMFSILKSTDNGTSYTSIWNSMDYAAIYGGSWSGYNSYMHVSFNMDEYIGQDGIKFCFQFVAPAGAGFPNNQAICVKNIKFNTFADPRLTINAEDTMTFFSYVGDPDVYEIAIEGRNLNANTVATASENFQVSADGITFGSTANIPAAGGTLYVQYNPATATSDNGTVVIANNYTDTTGTFADTTISKTIVVIGNSYDCSIVTVPFTQGFESEEGTILAPNATEYCWSAFKLNEADPQNNLVNSNNYAYEGNQSFRFSSAKFNNQRIYDQYLISPELNSEVPMMVRFNYANSSALKDETFAVGYSTTDKLLSSFTWEEDIVNEGNTDWQLYRNIEVPANVKYVAIHYKSERQAYLYIDNFQVKPVPTCPAPVEVKAESTAETTANIIWTPGDEEESWEYVYGVAPLNIESATPVAVTDNEVALSGLTANTHYQFAVRANCSEEENSEWSEVLDFWTTTTPATLPYNQTFEDNDQDRANWVLVNNGQPNFFKYLSIPGSPSGKGLAITKDGQSNVYLTPVGEFSTSRYSTVWAYRDILFSEVEEGVYGYLLSFDWKCYGEVDFDFGEVFIGNATAVTNFDRNEEHPNFVDVNETHYAPAGLTQLGRLQGETTIKKANYLIPAEGNEGMVKRIYFLWTNDSLSGSETPLGVDNIKIEVPVFANMYGYVTDATTGAAIAGATINISSESGFTASTVSEVDGSYRIDNIVADYYTITAEAAGYDPYTDGLNFSGGENEYDILMSVAPCAIMPTNVTYEIDDINMILHWDNIEGGTMSQAGNEQYYNAVTTGTSGDWGCYHLFTPSDLIAYNGCTLTKIGIFFNGDPAYCSYTIRIWVGGNANSASDEFGPASDYPVYEQVIAEDDITLGAWKDIDLTTPLEINGNQNLWIGYQFTYSGSNESAAHCNTTNEGRGNVMYFNGGWTTLLQEGLDGDWLIHGICVAPDLTYTVLEDGTPIATDIEDAEYIVDNYDPSACYQVQTTCENGQVSEPSECAQPGTSIADIDNAIAFSVYPNPATEVVTVATSQKAQKVEILNYLGQVIFAQAVQNNTFTLNVANYADGVYFIRLTGEEGVSTQKLIKK